MPMPYAEPVGCALRTEAAVTPQTPRKPWCARRTLPKRLMLTPYVALVWGICAPGNCPPARNTHSSQTLVNTGVLWEVS